MKRIAVLTLVFVGMICAVVQAQTTITTVPVQGTTVITETGGRYYEVPGGFPEGRPLVDTYLPPQTVVQTQVISGNSGVFQSGYYGGATGVVVQTNEVVVPEAYGYPYRGYRRSYRVPGARVYETIENRGIVSETQTVLQ